MKILLLGDVMGPSGRKVIENNLTKLINEYDIDFNSFTKNTLKNIKDKLKEKNGKDEMSIETDPSYLQESFLIKLKIQ